MSSINVDNDPILQKLIVEIRFRPNLNYFSDAFKLASSFEGDFEDWRTSHNPYHALLYSKSDGELLKVASDTIAIIFEGEYDDAKLQSRLDKVIKLLLTPNALEVVRRIGVRQIWIIPTDAEFNDLASGITESFSGNYEDHQELALDSVKDYAFILDGIKNGLKNHIQFGPVTPQEAKDRFKSSFEVSGEFSKKNCIYLDVDVFNDEHTEMNDIEKNAKTIIDESQRITSGYAKLIRDKVK